MKINNINSSQIQKPVDNNQNKRPKKVQEEQPAAIYEKSLNNKTHVYNKEAVLKLKQETEANKARILKLISDSLNRQGVQLDLINSLDLGKITNIDETARLEAEELLAEDGELGVEKTSQRIVDFAIALSGGDKSKAGSLRNAIENGFKEAKRILGGKLPKISQDTYEKTMEKFDSWASETK